MAENKPTRNYGIDLLRIASMLMIATLHTLYRGGVLSAVETGTAQYYVAYSIYLLCYIAVNLYALISGYVGVNGKTKYYKLASLWVQVEFYCVLFTVIFAFIHPEIYKFDFTVNQLFPVSTGHYWYFTAYFVMFLFTPYFNKILNSLGKRQLMMLGIILVFLSTLWSTVWQMDFMSVERGYSAVWLSVLYILGGIAKKLNFSEKAKSGWLLFGYFVCIAFVACFKFFGEKYGGMAITPNYFISYNSFPMFAGAFCLFLFFTRLNIKGATAKRLIGFFAPVSFGVYIIHANGFIWKYVMQNAFTPLAELNPVLLALCTALSALAIYLICSAIDWLRICLFRAIKVDERLKSLEDKIRLKLSDKKN